MSDESGISSEALTANRKQRLAEKAVITGKISDSCRFVGFGLLAVFYALKMGNDGGVADIVQKHPDMVFSVGLFGALAILFDYLQFLAAHISVEQALKQKESYEYPVNAALCLRYVFYYLKQIAVGLGALCLVLIVLKA